MGEPTPSMLRGTPRARLLLAFLIAAIPVERLRTALYRHLLGYRLGPGTSIGWCTVIACTGFSTGPGCVIGRRNWFVGPFHVALGERVIIARFNTFTAGAIAAHPSKAAMGYGLSLTVGDRALINDDHYFDLYGRITIGAGTWVAGVGSQFWTHGASVMDRDIAIGSGCYLGSAVRLAPGAAIADRCVLGLGSIVVGKLVEPDCVLSGHPARKLRAIGPDDERRFVFEVL